MAIDTNSIEFAKAVAAEVEKRVAEEVSKIKGVEKIGFKNTMNIDDIKDYHKMLKAKFSLSEISNALLVSEEVLKKQTPKMVSRIKEVKRQALNNLLSGKKLTIPQSGGDDSAPKANLTDKQQAKQDKGK